MAGRKAETVVNRKTYEVTAKDLSGVKNAGDVNFYNAFAFSHFIGCRPGELCKVTVEMVRVREDGTVCIDLPVSLNKKSGKLEGHKNAKHGKSRILECSISPECEALVLSLVKERKTGFLFVTKTGCAWSVSNLDECLRKIRQTGAVGKECTFYQNRHTAATTLVYTLGQSLETVAELLGNSPAVLRSNYLHGDSDTIRGSLVLQE